VTRVWVYKVSCHTWGVCTQNADSACPASEKFGRTIALQQVALAKRTKKPTTIILATSCAGAIDHMHMHGAWPHNYSMHAQTVCSDFAKLWWSGVLTEVCRLVEGTEAEVNTVVIILAIVLVYTDSHNTMATTQALAPSTSLQTSVSPEYWVWPPEATTFLIWDSHIKGGGLSSGWWVRPQPLGAISSASSKNFLCKVTANSCT
jgi:hypothetical protein